MLDAVIRYISVKVKPLITQFSHCTLISFVTPVAETVQCYMHNNSICNLCSIVEEAISLCDQCLYII